MHAYFGDWLPASTTVCINQLSSPGARIELDMIVALPKSAGEVALVRTLSVSRASEARPGTLAFNLGNDRGMSER